ncbi:ABC transporter permease [Nocardioides sp.]|uniref:ABC transporter permease n=1 Tax=Nocardioides sp. TaxID=35761 RepID=UPI0037837F97
MSVPPVVAGLRGSPALPITVATVALFALSPILVSGSLGRGPLATVIPFTCVLALTAFGQTLVIQQRGVDFSVAATVSLTSVITVKVADQADDRLTTAVAIALAVAIAVGLANAVLIGLLHLTPVIATLGVNTLVLGVIQRYSGARSVPPSPPWLQSAVHGEVFGIAYPGWILCALAVVGALIMSRTAAGHRFRAAGAAPRSAHVAGVPVLRQIFVAYVAASLLYGLAGVTLAGTVSAPQLDGGTPYLLASIAAAVLGGTSLAGGTGSIPGALIGSLFLVQLEQLLLGAGFSTAVIFVAQGAVIAVSMGTRTITSVLSQRRQAAASLREVGLGNDPTSDRGVEPVKEKESV